MVKAADSARVLRSGRRLWPDTVEGKPQRGGNDGGDEWMNLVKNSRKGGDGWPRGVVKAKQDLAVTTRRHEDLHVKKTKPVKEGDSLRERKDSNRMCGFVYSRRKRPLAESSGFSVTGRNLNDNKRWGLFFTRRQRRKFGEVVIDKRHVLTVVAKPLSGNSHWLSCFLVLLLRYVRRVELTLKELSAFVLAEPLYSAYASQGIQFLQVLLFCYCNVENVAFWFSQILVLSLCLNGCKESMGHDVFIF